MPIVPPQIPKRSGCSAPTDISFLFRKCVQKLTLSLIPHGRDDDHANTKQVTTSLAIVRVTFSLEDIPWGDARLKNAEDNSQGEKRCVVFADAVERHDYAPKSNYDNLVRLVRALI